MAGPWDKYGQGVQTKPADQLRPSQLIKSQNEAAASGFDPRKAQADARGQELINALHEADLRDRGLATEKAAQDRADRAAAAEAKANANSKNVYKLSRAINQLDELQRDASDNKGWLETGKSGSMSRKYLGDGYAGFDLGKKVDAVRGFNFVDAIRDMKSASATGSTGAGGLTETEGKKLEDAVAVLDPNMSHGEFLNQVNSARDFYLDSYRRLGGNDPLIDPSQAKPDTMDKSRGLVGNQSPDKVQLSTGSKDQVDPIMKAATGRIGKMVSSGASDAAIRDNLSKSGIDPANTNINKVLKYRQTPQFKAWQRQNPGQPYPMGPSFYTKKVALTPTQNMMNSAAQSVPGAFAISAANAVSGNHMDDIARMTGGDPEAVNTGMMLSQANNPGTSMVGDMAGQAMFEATLGRIPGVRALHGMKFGKMGGDALYGAYAGDGQGDAGGGALSNMAGGVLGRAAPRVAGGLLRGVNTPSLNYLNSSDVPVTLGQIGRGSGTTVGSAISGIEDRAAGLPGLDAIINTARRRGEQGFNEAGFREASGSGVTGSTGASELGDKVKQAYSFLDNTHLPHDAQFAGSQSMVRAGLPNLPAFGNEVGKGMDTIDRASMGGSLPGRDWQSAISDTRGNRSSIMGQPFAGSPVTGTGAVGALGNVEDNLLSLAERQGPPGTVGNLAGANKLNGQYQTVLSALDNGPTQARGELFSPSRLDTASRNGARNFQGRAASMRGERPFYDLTKAGMDVMPNQVPDSGTAGRALLYSALYGSAIGGGVGGATADQGQAVQDTGAGIGTGALAVPAILAALYSKGGQKGLQKMLLAPRKAAVKKLGEVLGHSDTVRGFGRLGASAARNSVLWDDLPQ